MITPKENYLNVIEHKDPAWTPIHIIDCAVTGFGALPGVSFEKGPLGGGKDGFGVNWISPASGGGAPIPAPNEFLMSFDQIEDWKSLVHFPDLDAFDWEGFADHELAGMDGQGIDRDRVAVEYGSGNGPYERIASLMGFENALLAIAMYPEATKELVEAIVDWKIEQIPYVKRSIDPDVYTNYDDFCTQKGPFMSPDAFREVFKPATTRYCEAIREAGIIPVQHTCGFAEPLVEDFIDCGFDAWTSVQPVNDIARLQREYGDRFTFIGGWDSNGPAAMTDATDETIVRELNRCFDEYGGKKGFILFAYRLTNSLDPQEIGAQNGRVLGPAIQLAFEKAGIELPAMA